MPIRDSVSTGRRAHRQVLRGRADLLRRRRDRPRLVHRLPARGRRDAPRGAVRRDRHLRRAGGARRVSERAAGGGDVLRAQPLPLVLPCHRVVAAGGLGGYGSLGVEFKRRLLELEGCASSPVELRGDPPRARARSPTRRCDRLAELSALFHTAGSLHLRGHGEIALHLDLSSPAVARRAFGLLREFGVESEIRTYRQRAFAKSTRYQLHVAGSALARQVLAEAGIVSATGAPLELPPKRVVGRACCRVAYVRGAFLGAGSVSGPRSPHLEIRCASLDAAELLVRIAALDDVVLRVRDRGRHAVAYAKGAEAIAETLALAGASDAALLARRARGRRRGACAREPARERRPRQPRPREPRCARAAPRGPRRLEAEGRLETAAGAAAGDRRPPRPLPVAVAPRAGSEVPAAGDEGGRPPAPVSACSRLRGACTAIDSRQVNETGGEMALRVGINGFGRIGRNFLRAHLERGGDFEIVAANDLGDAKTMAHLLKYDSVLGPLATGRRRGRRLDHRRRDRRSSGSPQAPAELPWGDLGVDVVIESTGLFTKRDQAEKHLDGGREEGRDLGAGDRSGRDGRARRQRRRVRRLPRTTSSRTPPARRTASRRWRRCCTTRSRSSRAS